MRNTFKNSKGSLSDKLVLALSKIGKIKNNGDIRCKENLNPYETIKFMNEHFLCANILKFTNFVNSHLS